MQTQDLFPYNSFTLGINNQYISLPDKRFLVNFKEVLSSDGIIAIGNRYLLLMSLNVRTVVLDDVFCDGTEVHLILYSQKEREMIFLKLRTPEDDSIQNWWLIDSNVATQIIEKLEVLVYCMS